MTNSSNRHSFRHALSIAEALNRIFEFEGRDETLTEILLLEFERADCNYSNAVTGGANRKDLQELKRLLVAAKKDLQRARDMTVELQTAADNINQGIAQPHLVLSKRKYYNDEPHFTKNSLYHWAKETWSIEIPEWKLPAHQAVEWRVWEHAEPGSKITEGQKLFLAIAWILDRLLSKTDGDWRDKIGDTTDKTRSGYIVEGKFELKKLVDRVVTDIPKNLSGSKPDKTVRDNLSLAFTFMTDRSTTVTELSARQIPMVRRTVFALARATWSTLTTEKCPVANTCDYPEGMTTTLADGLQDDAPFTPKDLEKCLTAARAEVVKKTPR